MKVVREQVNSPYATILPVNASQSYDVRGSFPFTQQTHRHAGTPMLRLRTLWPRGDSQHILLSMEAGCLGPDNREVVRARYEGCITCNG